MIIKVQREPRQEHCEREPSFGFWWKLGFAAMWGVVLLGVGSIAALIISASASVDLLNGVVQANTERIKRETVERTDDVMDVRKRQDMQRSYVIELDRRVLELERLMVKK